MPAHLFRLLFLLSLVAGSLSMPRAAGAGNPCAPVPPGLVGWWKLEGNGNDVTGLHNGVVLGGGFVPGEVGQGYAPAAVGDGLQVPDAPALNPQRFTLDAWVRLDALPLYNVGLFWKGNAAGTDVTSPFGLGIYGTIGGPPALAGLPFLTAGAVAVEQELDSGVLAPIGSLFHIAATADGTTLSLYLNGQLVASAPQTVTGVPSGYPLQIGGVTLPGAVNPGPTLIDEAEIHNAAATAAQILAIYEAGPAGKCPYIPTPARSSTWGRVKAYYSR
jgi:hypothetical protein